MLSTLLPVWFYIYILYFFLRVTSYPSAWFAIFFFFWFIDHKSLGSVVNAWFLLAKLYPVFLNRTYSTPSLKFSFFLLFFLRIYIPSTFFSWFIRFSELDTRMNPDYRILQQLKWSRTFGAMKRKTSMEKKAFVLQIPSSSLSQ